MRASTLARTFPMCEQIVCAYSANGVNEEQILNPRANGGVYGLKDVATHTLTRIDGQRRSEIHRQAGEHHQQNGQARLHVEILGRNRGVCGTGKEKQNQLKERMHIFNTVR